MIGSLVLRSLRNAHVFAVAGVLLLLLGAWMANSASEPGLASAGGVPLAPPPKLEAPLPAPPAVPVREPVRVPVRPGDSLALIFERHGIGAGALQLVLDSGPLGRRLKSIFPGHEFEFDLDDDGNLLSMTYRPGRLTTLVFRRVGDRFEGTAQELKPDEIPSYKHVVISDSLFQASQRAGLDDLFALRLAQIFQWDIDFILDIRKGDEFYVLYNEQYVDDEFFGYGDILAAEFVNQGDRYRAVRYVDDDGRAEYYTPEGESMRKAFLRAPLQFTRVSSQFNMNRRHPIFNRTMPHRGIDYAAATGTRVQAAGDGRVVTAGYTRPNGNYIVLQHGERFQTKYLHLSKIEPGVKTGRRVRQGQTIGRVGQTGYATGPHLHYEFLVDGVHRNPRIVNLDRAEAVAATDLPHFNDTSALLLAELERERSVREFAYLDTAL